MKKLLTFILFLPLISNPCFAQGKTDTAELPEPVCVAFYSDDGHTKTIELSPLNLGIKNRHDFTYEDNDVALVATVDQSVPQKSNVTTVISVPTLTKKGKLEFIGAGSTSSGSWGESDQVRNAYVIDTDTVYKLYCYKDKNQLASKK